MFTCKNNVCVPGKRTDCVPEEITDVNLEEKNTDVYLEKEWMYTWRKNGCVPGERTDVYLEKEWMYTYL